MNNQDNTDRTASLIDANSKLLKTPLLVTKEKTIELQYYFTLHIYNRSDKPDLWTASLVDYDGATGCMGIFNSEEQLEQWINPFLEIAHKLYDEKHAKYGPTPEVSVVDDKLFVDLYPKEQEQAWNL